MLECTLAIAGGTVVGLTIKTAGSRYFEHKLEDTKLGKLMFAVTGLQSHAGSEELKKMGPRGCTFEESPRASRCRTRSWCSPFFLDSTPSGARRERASADDKSRSDRMRFGDDWKR